MNDKKVARIHPTYVQLGAIDEDLFERTGERSPLVKNGEVFRVISPKIEGKKHVRNDGIYRKEGDSHSVRIGSGEDCIFHRNTLVEIIPNSRFSGSAALTA